MEGSNPLQLLRGIMANLVTLQNYKDFAGITGVSEDAKLNVIIPSISQAVKSYCGSSIVDYYSTNKTEYFDITNDMTLPEGAKVDVYEDVWKYEVNGTVNEYSTADKPWEIEGAVFVDRQTKLIEEGDHPPIKDFSIESDAIGDITDSVLAAPNSLLFVMYDLSKSNLDALKSTEKIINGFSEESLTVVALSSTTESQMEQIVKDAGISYPFYFTDETTLKTIVRSNPGMLWLKKGTIVGKWHFNDFPDSQNLVNQYLR